MNADELLSRISPEQRLLLQAVLRDDDHSVAAFDEWRSRVDIADIDDESHRLLPLLARRMADLAPDDPVRGLVRGVYRLAWVKNRLLTRDAASLASALHAAGVRVLILKGAALVHYYHGDFGLRPMYDLDLLVPYKQLGAALGVLHSENWRPRSDMSDEWLIEREARRRHSHAFSRSLEEQLDLHWHVLAGSIGERADEPFWARAAPFELAGVQVLGLREPDLLLHVLAHGARLPKRGNVQWVADAVHIVRASEHPRLAAELATGAQRAGLVETARAGLEVIGLLFAEPRIDSLLQELDRTRPRAIERLANARTASSFRRAATAVAAYGGVAGAARAAFDLPFVRHPTLYAAYVLSGRRALVARVARRVAGPLTRTSRSTPGGYELGRELDFTEWATLDEHAGLGWWTADEHGLRSHGREARLVIDVVPGATGDVLLDLVVQTSSGEARSVEVRVNESPVAVVEAGGSSDGARVIVPASVAWRFRPMEIALLAARHHRGRRTRLGLQLLRVTLAPADSTTAVAPLPDLPRGLG